MKMEKVEVPMTLTIMMPEECKESYKALVLNNRLLFQGACDDAVNSLLKKLALESTPTICHSDKKE